ncbi:hypothetical protein F4X33_15310 [Candidatus Poribacteria bacterium]|nr:hypothetical protein [Candidatus Poribacteria bacterium]
MDRAEIERIRQVIEELAEQINSLNASMSVDILSKSVLKKEELCNLLVQIAEHKHLIEQLETDVSHALGVDVKRLADSLNADRKISS